MFGLEQTILFGNYQEPQTKDCCSVEFNTNFFCQNLPLNILHSTVYTWYFVDPWNLTYAPTAFDDSLVNFFLSTEELYSLLETMTYKLCQLHFLRHWWTLTFHLFKKQFALVSQFTKLVMDVVRTWSMQSINSTLLQLFPRGRLLIIKTPDKD